MYLSDPPSDENKTPREDKPSEPVMQEGDSKNRIVILEERDIPFREERPPNLSPNFEVKVHRSRQQKSSEANDE